MGVVKHMNGVSAMVGYENELHVPEALSTAGTDAELKREMNESTAIIEGWTELLIEAGGALEENVQRAALESIRRHAVRLKDLLSQR